MGNTYNPQSQSGRGFNGLPAPFGGGEHVDPYIVARVLPRTSKGITDLLLLSLLRLDAADPSKKILRRTPLAEPQRARQDEDPEHRRRAGPKLNRAASARAVRRNSDGASRRRRRTTTKTAPPPTSDDGEPPTSKTYRREREPRATPPAATTATTTTRPRRNDDGSKRPPPENPADGNPSWESIRRLVSRIESRSLSESTRQIAPPTKNGHAPPTTESRKSSQSVNPSSVWAW
ncbi:UNVERIFIED_CONTAM: hypothetical protein RMT77_018152 [Armadillidium vulgare]